MAQISFRVDDNVKRDAEETLDVIGLSMSAAMNIFLKKIAREKRIPFELTADPFYSESNIRYLEKKMEDYKKGKLRFSEHKPNETTYVAMKNSENREDIYGPFGSVSELMEEISR